MNTATSDEWVRSGFRQLTLCLAWERYAHLAQERKSPLTSGGAVADWLRKHVAEVYASASWFGDRARVLSAGCREGAPQDAWRPFNFAPCEQAFRRRLAPPSREADALPLPEALGPITAALDACLNGSASKDDRLPPIRVPAAKLVDFWLREAAALDAWFTVQPRLSEEKDGELVREAQELAARCRQRQDVLVARGRVLASRRFLPGQSPEESKVLSGSARLLGACADLWKKMVDGFSHVLGDQNVKERRVQLQAIEDQLALAPSGWPPKLLAELAGAAGLIPDMRSELRADAGLQGEGWRSLAPFGEDTRARLALAVLLLKALDRAEEAGPLAAPARAGVAGCLGRLLAPAGLRPEVLRKDSDDPAVCERRETRGGRGVRVTATGLRVQEDGAEPVVIRKVRVDAPERPPPLVAALEALASQVQDHDGILADLCLGLAAAVRGPEGKGGGQEQEVEKHAVVWRILNRTLAAVDAAPACRAAAVELTQQLEAAGYRLEETPADRTDLFAGGPWVLIADPRAAEVAPLVPGSPPGRPALRLPDDRLLLPSLWLRLPRLASAHPLLRCLIDAEPLLAALKIADGEWAKWKDFDRDVLRLATSLPAAGAGPDIPTAKKLLLAVYRRSGVKKMNDDARPLYHELARRLYRGMTEKMGVPLFPALDRDTLRAPPLESPPADGTRVKWQTAHKASFGTIVDVERFGSPGDPGQVCVSASDSVPPGLLRWLVLPPPPFEGTARDLLTQWRREAELLPWNPKDAVKQERRRAEQFRTWAASAEGAVWFNRLVRGLLSGDAREEAAAGRAWLNTLVEASWCQCVPAVDWPTGRAVWPDGLSPHADGVSWKFSDTTPLGFALDGAFDFAPTPQQVRGVFSLGPKRRGPALAAVRLADAVATPPGLADALAGAMRALLEASIAAHLAGKPVARPEALALPVLDALTGWLRRHAPGVLQAPPVGEGDVAGPPPDGTAKVLDLLREWCGEAGDLVILPPDGSLPPRPPVDMPAEEYETAAPTFAEGSRPGGVGLERYGLRGPKGVIRTCRTTPLAGEEPRHYAALRDRVESLGAEAAPLREALDSWPGIFGEGNPGYALVDFLTKFWSRLGGDFRERQPAVFEELERMLDEVLAAELKATPFYPVHYKDYPETWLDIRGGALRSGRVRLLRPGLKNADETLRVKAIVEVE